MFHFIIYLPWDVVDQISVSQFIFYILSTYLHICKEMSLSFSKMDAIKKKMQSLKTETENAMARADQLDAEFRAATTLAEKTEETVRDLQKKMQHVENELDITLEKLTQTTTKFDEKEKAYAVAEGEIQALKRKIALLEDELERKVLLQFSSHNNHNN